MMKNLVAVSTLVAAVSAGAGWAPAAVAESANVEARAVPRVNVIPRQNSDWRRTLKTPSSGTGQIRYRENDESHETRNANGFREELEGGRNRDD